MKQQLTDRELQIIEHALESFADGFFVAPTLQSEIKALYEKVRLIRNPAPKNKKGYVHFQTMDGSWVSFKPRK